MDRKNIENLKAKAFDLIRQIDIHTFEIQRLREQLNRLSVQIANEEKNIRESQVSTENKPSKDNKRK
ncbi:MAG TPA: hypothetical protein VMZ91_16790 [Candidatus Paceibacterota bacterium]|nr:hypothetical protein [Candidatus Paceibacterota bacterium]